MRRRLRAGEAREIAEPHAGPLLNGRPSFYAIVIHSLGKTGKFLQIVERQLERTIHHSGNFESPLASLRLIPYGNSFRHVVAWQSIAGKMRPGECSVHMNVSQQRALDDFIFSLGIS